MFTYVVLLDGFGFIKRIKIQAKQFISPQMVALSWKLKMWHLGVLNYLISLFLTPLRLISTGGEEKLVEWNVLVFCFFFISARFFYYILGPIILLILRVFTWLFLTFSLTWALLCFLTKRTWRTFREKWPLNACSSQVRNNKDSPAPNRW